MKYLWVVWLICSGTNNGPPCIEHNTFIGTPNDSAISRQEELIKSNKLKKGFSGQWIIYGDENDPKFTLGTYPVERE